MLEILGYMVAAYGIARLAQTTFVPDVKGPQLIAGILGIAVLVVLALQLGEQADAIGSLGV